jgi:hypothetical protein
VFASILFDNNSLTNIIALIITTMGSIERANDHTALQKDLDEVNAAAEKYLKLPPEANGQDARFDLYVKATRLLHTVRGPTDIAFSHFENVRTLYQKAFARFKRGY